MAGFFRNLGKRIVDFVRGGPRELPKPEPRVKPNAGPRQLPRELKEELPHKSTPETYVERLTELSNFQDRVRNLEAVMFDESLSEDIRQEALQKYYDLTGWWRPENNGDWTNEEWRRWEQIYESEPELW